MCMPLFIIPEVSAMAFFLLPLLTLLVSALWLLAPAPDRGLGSKLR